jgi:hypothetical protein
MITQLQLDQIRAKRANRLDEVRPLRWYTDARDGLCPDEPEPLLGHDRREYYIMRERRASYRIGFDAGYEYCKTKFLIP